MFTVNDLLKVKGNKVWTIKPEITVFEALQIMAEKNVGALVVAEKDKVVGIFSERDYARKVILQGKASKSTNVSESMSQSVLFVDPDRTIDECMEIMTVKHIRHLPVLVDNKLVGLISIGDVVNKLISDKEIKIQNFEKYIIGGYY